MKDCRNCIACQPGRSTYWPKLLCHALHIVISAPINRMDMTTEDYACQRAETCGDFLQRPKENKSAK